MAKTSMINKQQKEPKFSTRAYTRCRLCGRPHSVLRKYGMPIRRSSSLHSSSL